MFLLVLLSTLETVSTSSEPLTSIGGSMDRKESHLRITGVRITLPSMQTRGFPPSLVGLESVYPMDKSQDLIGKKQRAQGIDNEILKT